MLGLIDIGSHAVKMYIFEVYASKKQWKIVDSLWLPTQIGRDIFTRGAIRQETINEIHLILKRFQEVLTSYQVKETKAFITSSLSEAGNSESVLSRCENILGIPVTIIHPYQENEAVYLAISDILKLHPEVQNETTVIFYMGSGSSRLFLRKNNELLLSQAYHTGTLRFIQYFPPHSTSYEAFFYPFIKHLKSTVQSVVSTTPHRMVLLNDDIIKMLEYTGRKETKNMYHITLQELEKITLNFLSLPEEELSIHYGILNASVKTIKMNLAFCLTLLRHFGLDELWLPHTVSTFGFAYEILRKNEKEILPAILSSAKTIAKRYQYDEFHAHKVVEFSKHIFQALQKRLRLDKKEEMYLELAALLHDIGYFISATNHHKNTYELLRRSEIFGLHTDDLHIIALVARYHRKSAPKNNHPEFMGLEMDARITVTRLAAILRIANALDICHQQIIAHFSAELKHDTLHLVCRLVPASGKVFELIEAAVNNNKGLFENFFGIKVVIETV